MHCHPRPIGPLPSLRSTAIPALAAVVFLAGCAASGPQRVEAQNPRVSYSYDLEDVEIAKQDAARYCHENYGRAARVVGDVDRGDERVMTFECVPQ